MMNSKNNFLTLFYIGILLCICSCKKDQLLPNTPPTVVDGAVEFNVQLPGLHKVISTYSITDKEENNIQSIDVLAFMVNNRGLANESETFAFRTTGYSISTPNAADPSRKRFKIRLEKDTVNRYRFVVLANVRRMLDATTIAANETKANLMARLVYEHTGAIYDSAPMWGETAQLMLGNTANAINITLLRNLARIDVNLVGTALSDFAINSISLLNSPSSGLIAPVPTNYSATASQVTAASLPPSRMFNSQFVTYNVPSPGVALTQEIYTFESPKSDLTANQTTATELIIGGRYKGSAVVTYYRIAFTDPEGNAMPLLRNYKYTVNISKVGGVGYPSMDSAAKNVPANMNVSTTTLDDSGLNIIATDGQYILALSTDQLTIGGGAKQTGTFILYTDYPDGWLAESEVSWLKITHETS